MLHVIILAGDALLPTIPILKVQQLNLTLSIIKEVQLYSKQKLF